MTFNDKPSSGALTLLRASADDGTSWQTIGSIRTIDGAGITGSSLDGTALSDETAVGVDGEDEVDEVAGTLTYRITDASTTPDASEDQPNPYKFMHEAVLNKTEYYWEIQSPGDDVNSQKFYGKVHTLKPSTFERGSIREAAFTIVRTRAAIDFDAQTTPATPP